MPHAQNLLRSGADQTRRLVSDLAAPLVRGMRGVGGRCGAGFRSGMACARTWSRDGVRSAGKALPLLLVGLGLGVGAGLLLLFLNASQTTVQANAPAAEAAGPVKIVDAAPRSASCEEQVWPYIEHRCLKRAPAVPPVKATDGRASEPVVVAGAPAHDAPAAPEAAAVAPATPAVEPALSTEPVDANGAPLQRQASIAQIMDRETAVLAGAGAAAGGLAAWHLAERRAEPRRRSARRGYARRPALSVFGLRF